MDTCDGCRQGGECDLRDGVDAALLEVLSNMSAEDTAHGTRVLLERALAGWHDCRSGRASLLRALSEAESSDANALGTMLLIAHQFDLPGVAGWVGTLTKPSM